MKKINLPFTTEKKGKSKSFKILYDNDFDKKGGNSLFNEIKRIISNNSNNNNNSKIKYIKASESLKYQKK
jgi:hypothetical protein